MAAGATHGQAEERCACGGDDVVQIVGALLEFALDRGVADEVMRSTDEKAGGSASQEVVLDKNIISKLFVDKLAIWEIAIVGVDDVIAIGPGAGAERVHLIAMALGEADDVEPVPGLPLAVVRRGQEPI